MLLVSLIERRVDPTPHCPDTSDDPPIGIEKPKPPDSCKPRAGLRPSFLIDDDTRHTRHTRQDRTAIEFLILILNTILIGMLTDDVLQLEAALVQQTMTGTADTRAVPQHRAPTVLAMLEMVAMPIPRCAAPG